MNIEASVSSIDVHDDSGRDHDLIMYIMQAVFKCLLGNFGLSHCAALLSTLCRASDADVSLSSASMPMYVWLLLLLFVARTHKNRQ